MGLDPKESTKYVMVPANVRVRRKVIEERMRKLEEYADKFRYNKMEINDPSIGVITAGAAYMYTKDVFPQLLLPEAGHGLAPSEEDDRRLL